jgi:hypothetical protein
MAKLVEDLDSPRISGGCLVLSIFQVVAGLKSKITGRRASRTTIEGHTLATVSNDSFQCFQTAAGQSFGRTMVVEIS